MRAVICVLSPMAQAALPPRVMRLFEDALVRDGDALGALTLTNRFSLPWFGLGKPRTALLARMDKPLRLPEPVVETGKRPEKPAPSLL